MEQRSLDTGTTLGVCVYQGGVAELINDSRHTTAFAIDHVNRSAAENADLATRNVQPVADVPTRLFLA
jgi:hypothetical protein